MSYYGFGSVGVRYTKRPPKNRKAARAAWDFLTQKEGRNLAWLKFLDGHWGFQCVGSDDIDEIEGMQFRYGGGSRK